MYWIQCTEYSVQYTVYRIQCTEYSVLNTVYWIQCTVYSVQNTVYRIQRTELYLYYIQWSAYISIQRTNTIIIKSYTYIIVTFDPLPSSKSKTPVVLWQKLYEYILQTGIRVKGKRLIYINISECRRICIDIYADHGISCNYSVVCRFVNYFG